MKKIATIQSLAGLAIICLATVILLGWLTRTPLLVQIRPNFVGMVVNTALCFALLGITLLLPVLKVRKIAAIQTAIGAFIFALSALVLLQIMSDVDFGIDLRSFHSWLSDGNPHAGRMAPNTAVGFMLAGLILIAASRVQSKTTGVFIQIATFAILMLGLTGIVGYTLQLELLYSWFKAARMALHTAMGMTLVGLGLWSSWRRADWYRSQQFFKEDEKIAFVGAALLVVIALTVGVAGFAAQQSSLEKALTDSMPSAVRSQTTIFQSAVNQAKANGHSFASRRNLLRLTRALATQPDDEALKAELKAIGESALAFGMSGLIIYDLSQRELLRLGSFADHAKIAFAVDAESTLIWDGRLVLNTVTPLRDAHNIIGSVIVEEPLPTVNQQFANADGLGNTGEMGMCFRRESKLQCFPQYRNPKVYQSSGIGAKGKPTAMSYAVDGKAGTFKGLDYRGKSVLAAYGPLTLTGLGIVIKKDTEELFQPIRDQLNWSVPALLLLVTLGALLLRSQITPLASRLLRSERDATEKEIRIRTVVDSVGEGIITLDETGMIESFNNGASAIFGYAPDEVIGLNIKMLMPPHMRAAHEAGMQRFLQGGVAHVVGKKGVELPGLHKDGSEFSLELAVNLMQIDASRRFVGIVRDITERKEAENALFQEKERLHVTLSSIGDAVITTDVEGKVTYLNPVAETMTGWSNAEAHGRPLPEVFHIVHELTNELALNPVEIVLRHQQVAALAENTLLIQRGGARFSVEDSAAPILNKQGEIVGVVLVFHDVSHARQMAMKMTHQATHDALTGIINRPEFERRLEQALQTGKLEAKHHTMLYLDLDQFKIVNDTCGHGAGDELLRQLTSIMLEKLRQSDTLARLGGDEFGVLLESCAGAPALRIAELLRQTVCDFHFCWLDKIFPIGVSIGLITFSNGGTTVADILSMADAACFMAKDKGRNRVQVYAQEDAEVARRHGEMGWIGRIQAALEQERFILYSQKILPLGGTDQSSEGSKNHGAHFELLLRMTETDGSLIPPMAFIPAAERYGLMPLLDRWVINAAFARIAQLPAGDNSIDTCAINLSGTSICDDGFLHYVLERFAHYQIAPALICFEITETAAITNLTQAAVLIRELKTLGCRFSLDDFGSGMSSFAYLKHLPVDYLKIDGGFVKDMIDDPIDCAMVEAINHIGHVMGILTIAEFVENDTVLSKLREIGIDFAQGYGIEKPRPM
ncbi:MAG: EAL domain-containing protein [Pseudomonadota bacterium]